MTVPTTAVDDPVVTEIERLRAEVRDRQERITQLLKLRSHPTVVPVLHYWRHYREYREEALFDDWPALETAYRTLAYQADDGQCSPEGVIVGGHEFSFGELEDRFGEIS